jgi:hypothetical protein
MLTESYGYKKEDIVIMVDKKGVRPELLPTKENIVRYFCLLFFFLFSCPLRLDIHLYPLLCHPACIDRFND